GMKLRKPLIGGGELNLDQLPYLVLYGVHSAPPMISSRATVSPGRIEGNIPSSMPMEHHPIVPSSPGPSIISGQPSSPLWICVKLSAPNIRLIVFASSASC